MLSDNTGAMPETAYKKVIGRAGPSMRRILLFILVKYIVFYISQMFFSGNYYFIQPGIRNGQDLFYYLWLFLFMPVLITLLFAILLQYALAARNKYLTAIFLVAFTAGEYFLFSYFTNADYMQSVRNSLITVGFLWLFFRKYILARSKPSGSKLSVMNILNFFETDEN